MPFAIGDTDYIAKLNALEAQAGTTTYSDSVFSLYNSTDNTKMARFSAASVTTATTRTYTLPNVDGSLISGANTAQTLAGNITFTNSAGTFGGGTGTGTVNLASGATTSGATKTVNIGTGGASGSTTNITLGPSAGGGTLTFNLIPVAAGIKITTASVSTDVNTLDYYQEGSFTPVISGTTAAGAGTYSVQTGLYTRIGNRVHFHLSVAITAHTGTGNMIVTGLPFPSETTMVQPVVLRCENLTYTTSPSASVPANSSKITIERTTTNGAIAAVAMDTACQLWISGTYMVA